MPRTVAREIAFLLVSASVVVLVPPARGDDPKAQAEKKATKAPASTVKPTPGTPAGTSLPERRLSRSCNAGPKSIALWLPRKPKPAP